MSFSECILFSLTLDRTITLLYFYILSILTLLQLQILSPLPINNLISYPLVILVIVAHLYTRNVKYCIANIASIP